jgi:threonine/homoserine/homoserine lactone efflux protein
VIAALALGLVLGIASSLPPGPCGLAIVATVAAGGSQRRAIATAFGGALGDLAYSTLGLIGIAPWLAPWTGLLEAISGVVMIGYGATKLRGRVTPVGTDHAARGVGVGFVLVLGNPAALITWVVIVGARLATATLATRACVVVGITLGTFTWFSLIARLARRGTRGGLARISAVLGAVLMCIGVVSLARAAETWFG